LLRVIRIILVLESQVSVGEQFFRHLLFRLVFCDLLLL
jgi:hypothetical protein